LLFALGFFVLLSVVSSRFFALRYALSALLFPGLRESAVKYPVIVRNRQVVVCGRLPTNNNVFLLADI